MALVTLALTSEEVLTYPTADLPSVARRVGRDGRWSGV